MTRIIPNYIYHRAGRRAVSGNRRRILEIVGTHPSKAKENRQLTEYFIIYFNLSHLLEGYVP
jgi:hypothetical protein